MPTADEKHRLLARLVSEKGINFNLDSDPEDWPAPYSGVFSKVRQLQDVKFGTYSEAAHAERDKAPWKRRKLLEAKHLVQLAWRCIRERQNEAGWRSQVEHHIFGPFTYGSSW